MTQLGKYEILEEIGRGGFAVVYKARDTILDRVVALKVLDLYWAKDPSFVTRFRQEARSVANLRHPNIVTIYDAGEADGQLFIAMEYLPGRTLRELLEAEGALSLERALPVLEQVAAALDYAHNQGIIHRDVKPSNIIVEETEHGLQATLTDFGLVKAMTGSTVLTSQGTLLGSPEYMAPEQADPERAAEVGPAADRYALGIVAYQMLTGRVPFPGNTPATFYAHEHKPVPRPRSLRPELPRRAAAALLKMLAKAPGDRYPSASAFVAELRRVLRSEREPRQPLPNWAWVAGAGLGVLALIAVVFLLIRGGGSTLPSSAKLGDTWIRPADRMVMVYVPGGTFQMGSADGEDDEQPVHALTLDSFWIDKYEVTNAQFAAFLNERGNQTQGGATWLDLDDEDSLIEEVSGDYRPKSGYQNHPVIFAYWYGAAAYCEWAGGRLPTEAEWEYAARGREGSVYPWGDEFDCLRGNFDDETQLDDYVVPGGAGCDGYDRTAPVGSFEEGASWCKALDMAGNVWEWVDDWYDGYPGTTYQSDAFDTQYKVLRGGSWVSGAYSVRSAIRYWFQPHYSYSVIGFRCVGGSTSSQ